MSRLAASLLVLSLAACGNLLGVEQPVFESDPAADRDDATGAPAGRAAGNEDGGTDAPVPEAAPPASDASLDSAPPSDGGACGTIGGLAVYCVAPGGVFKTTGSLTYKPGFPAGLPAMGLGQPGLGYLPASYPFTCAAKVGTRALAPPHNSPDGKICEVSFDNTNTTTVTGSAVYVVRVDSSAPAGTYAFGLTANAGTTVLTPAFHLKISRPPALVGRGGT